MRRVVLALVLASGFGSVGCSHMNHTERGAVTGGALGTAAGLGIGALTGNPKTGALVGGLGGAAVGGIVGGEKDADERRDREIIHAEAMANAQAQAQAQRMGLTDVIHMAQQGHDDQVIINQIRATGSTFQLTTSDLDFLKSNSVSSRVIAEMQSRPATVVPATHVIRDPEPRTTIIYQERIRPRPVVVVPHRYHCRPPVYIHGHFGHCW